MECLGISKTISTGSPYLFARRARLPYTKTAKRAERKIGQIGMAALLLDFSLQKPPFLYEIFALLI